MDQPGSPLRSNGSNKSRAECRSQAELADLRYLSKNPHLERIPIRGEFRDAEHQNIFRRTIYTVPVASIVIPGFQILVELGILVSRPWALYPEHNTLLRVIRIFIFLVAPLQIGLVNIWCFRKFRQWKSRQREEPGSSKTYRGNGGSGGEDTSGIKRISSSSSNSERRGGPHQQQQQQEDQLQFHSMSTLSPPEKALGVPRFKTQAEMQAEMSNIELNRILLISEISCLCICLITGSNSAHWYPARPACLDGDQGGDVSAQKYERCYQTIPVATWLPIISFMLFEMRNTFFQISIVWACVSIFLFRFTSPGDTTEDLVLRIVIQACAWLIASRVLTWQCSVRAERFESWVEVVLTTERAKAAQQEIEDIINKSFTTPILQKMQRGEIPVEVVDTCTYGVIRIANFGRWSNMCYPLAIHMDILVSTIDEIVVSVGSVVKVKFCGDVYTVATSAGLQEECMGGESTSSSESSNIQHQDWSPMRCVFLLCRRILRQRPQLFEQISTMGNGAQQQHHQTMNSQILLPTRQCPPLDLQLLVHHGPCFFMLTGSRSLSYECFGSVQTEALQLAPACTVNAIHASEAAITAAQNADFLLRPGRGTSVQLGSGDSPNFLAPTQQQQQQQARGTTTSPSSNNGSVSIFQVHVGKKPVLLPSAVPVAAGSVAAGSEPKILGQMILGQNDTTDPAAPKISGSPGPNVDPELSTGFYRRLLIQKVAGRFPGSFSTPDDLIGGTSTSSTEQQQRGTHSAPLSPHRNNPAMTVEDTEMHHVADVDTAADDEVEFFGIPDAERVEAELRAPTAADGEEESDNQKGAGSEGCLSGRDAKQRSRGTGSSCGLCSDRAFPGSTATEQKFRLHLQVTVGEAIRSVFLPLYFVMSMLYVMLASFAGTKAILTELGAYIPVVVSAFVVAAWLIVVTFGRTQLHPHMTLLLCTICPFTTLICATQLHPSFINGGQLGIHAVVQMFLLSPMIITQRKVIIYVYSAAAFIVPTLAEILQKRFTALNLVLNLATVGVGTFITIGRIGVQKDLFIAKTFSEAMLVATKNEYSLQRGILHMLIPAVLVEEVLERKQQLLMIPGLVGPSAGLPPSKRARDVVVASLKVTHWAATVVGLSAPPSAVAGGGEMQNQSQRHHDQRLIEAFGLVESFHAVLDEVLSSSTQPGGEKQQQPPRTPLVEKVRLIGDRLTLAGPIQTGVAPVVQFGELGGVGSKSVLGAMVTAAAARTKTSQVTQRQRTADLLQSGLELCRVIAKLTSALQTLGVVGDAPPPPDNRKLFDSGEGFIIPVEDQEAAMATEVSQDGSVPKLGSPTSLPEDGAHSGHFATSNNTSTSSEKEATNNMPTATPKGVKGSAAGGNGNTPKRVSETPPPAPRTRAGVTVATPSSPLAPPPHALPCVPVSGALHWGPGVAQVLGSARPTFDLVGPVTVVADGLCDACPLGSGLHATEPFLRYMGWYLGRKNGATLLPAPEIPEIAELKPSQSWSVVGAGQIRTQRIVFR